MKRFLLALALIIAGGLFTSASAHHGYWGGGWGGYHGGWRGNAIGWRGHGYRGIGWGGFNTFAFRGFYPRVAVYSNFYAPAFYSGYGFQSFHTPAFYAPAYRAYFAPAFYQGCDTTAYSNVIASYVPPAEYYYGPQAVQRFLGTNVVNNNANNQAAEAVALAANLIRAIKPQLPTSQAYAAAPVAQQNVISIPSESLPLARSRARKMVELGDRYFAEQKYYDAVQKYQEATSTAPDLSEAQFRLAHAQTALGRFPEAAAAFRQAMATNPNIARDGFKLDQLYGAAQIAKNSHLEAAAGAALQAPNDTGYLLVVGMFLQYDGQSARAEKFLRKAWEQGDRAPNLARFWNAEEPKVLVADLEI